MTRLLSLLIILLTVCCSCSYYQDISGKVVDNETGQPIEGALVVAQWTKQRGIPGLQSHELHKIVETLTDKEGTFSLSGTSGYLLDRPEMIIYKKNYVPWRNDAVFPSYDIIKDHEWNNNHIYKLDVLKSNCTATQVYYFIDIGMVGLGRKESALLTNVLLELDKQR